MNIRHTLLIRKKKSKQIAPKPLLFSFLPKKTEQTHTSTHGSGAISAAKR
jgi:hypothetical protein